MKIVEVQPGVFVRVRPEDVKDYPAVNKAAASAEHKARTVAPARSKRAKPED